jgi:ferredoxin
VHIKVDREACQGHALCVMYADELYEISETDGRAVVRLDPVPEAWRDAARHTVLACPERAISLVEDP